YLLHMRVQTFFPILLSVAAMLTVLACSGDDNEKSSTPTAAASPTAGPRTATPPVVGTPSRTKPAAADKIALVVLDGATFLKEGIGTGTLGTAECQYEPTDAIVDCSSAGFGKIALDPAPEGIGPWTC